MAKAKTTKRALLMSVLSMLLCVSMLVGSTFAWFTDSVTSGNNKIVAGNLSVDLVHVGGGEEGEDVSIKENPNHLIFDYDKWEPGYTALATLKVENKGTLALKYKLFVLIKGATEVENAEGEKTTLADVIDVYVYSGSDGEGYKEPKSFADITAENSGWQKAGTLASLAADTMISGNLLPEGKEQKKDDEAVGSVQMTVALHMQELAGNEYQGRSLGDLSLTLSADQYTYEEDSFDNGYDEAVAYPTTIADGLYYDDEGTYYVTNANGLTAMTNKINEYEEFGYQYPQNHADDKSGFINNKSDPGFLYNKTVKLTRNIDLGGVEWLPIGGFGLTSKQFAGTFDGQGYTVSNFKITKKNIDREDKNRSSHGLFGNVSGTIKNLTVKDVTIELKDAANGNPVGALVGRLNGGSIENCHVVDSNLTTNDWQIGGLVGQNNAGDIKGCSVVNTTVTGRSAVGAIAGIRVSKGESTIEKCSVKGCTLVMDNPYGGIYDEMFGVVLGATYNADDGVATVNVKACTIESTTIKGTASSVVCGYIETGATVNVTD